MRPLRNQCGSFVVGDVWTACWCAIGFGECIFPCGCRMRRCHGCWHASIRPRASRWIEISFICVSVTPLQVDAGGDSRRRLQTNPQWSPGRFCLIDISLCVSSYWIIHVRVSWLKCKDRSLVQSSDWLGGGSPPVGMWPISAQNLLYNNMGLSSACILCPTRIVHWVGCVYPRRAQLVYADILRTPRP